MKIRNCLIITFVAAISLQSCNKIHDVIVGIWFIDYIYYKNSPVTSFPNAIIFKNSSCEFPEVQIQTFEGLSVMEKDIGDYTVIKKSANDYRIKFRTVDTLFSGEHRLIFRKDQEQKLLKLEIRSDSFDMVCTKVLFNYDENIELIKELLSETNAGTQ